MLKKNPVQQHQARRKPMPHQVPLQQAQCLSRRLLQRVHRQHAQGNLMLHVAVSLGAGAVITMDLAAKGAIIRATGGTVMTDEVAGSSGDARLASAREWLRCRCGMVSCLSLRFC